MMVGQTYSMNMSAANLNHMSVTLRNDVNVVDNTPCNWLDRTAATSESGRLVLMLKLK